MAFQLRPSATATFVLRDEEGTISRMQVRYPSDTTVAAAQADADALAAQLDAISGCAVDGYSLNWEVYQDTPTAPTPDGVVEVKGQFGLLAANGQKVIVEVPGIIGTLVSPAGTIDRAQAGVSAFVNSLLTGVWSSNVGSDLVAAVYSRRVARSTTKRGAPPKI